MEISPEAQAARVVVFRPGALGDTILSIDALLALRARFPDAVVELVGHQQAGGLLVEAGIVDVATSFESNAVTRLFRIPPQVGPDWQGARAVVLWLKAGAPIAAAFRAAGVPNVLSGSPEAREGHTADHLVRMLEPLGIDPASRRVPLGAAPLKAVWSAGSSTASQSSRILIHPGSGSPVKNWPPDRFAALAVNIAQRSEHEIALLQGPADELAVRAVAHELDQLGLRLPVLAPADIRSLAVMLARARLLVGNDSGVSHLSAAVGTPTVAIFGPTDSARWAPRGPRVAIPRRRGPWPTVRSVRAAAVRLLSTQGQQHTQNEGDK